MNKYIFEVVKVIARRIPERKIKVTIKHDNHIDAHKSLSMQLLSDLDWDIMADEGENFIINIIEIEYDT